MSSEHYYCSSDLSCKHDESDDCVHCYLCEKNIKQFYLFFGVPKRRYVSAFSSIHTHSFSFWSLSCTVSSYTNQSINRTPSVTMKTMPILLVKSLLSSITASIASRNHATTKMHTHSAVRFSIRNMGYLEDSKAFFFLVG